MTREPSTRVLVVCAMLALSSPALAQTTGSISGQVTAQTDGSTLPGAQITAVHGPTGTRYTAISSTDGRFRILNVRVGGPYSSARTPASRFSCSSRPSTRR